MKGREFVEVGHLVFENGKLLLNEEFKPKTNLTLVDDDTLKGSLGYEYDDGSVDLLNEISSLNKDKYTCLDDNEPYYRKEYFRR